MKDMQYDGWALWVILGMMLLFWWLHGRKKKFKEASVAHSALADFQIYPSPLRVRLALLPKIFYAAASLFLLFAFLDPHHYVPKKRSGAQRVEDPTEGRVIFLALDQSGSMNESSGKGGFSKLDLMKEVMQDFVKERPEDLMGLISFARTVKILAPPTLDHSALLNEIAHLKTAPTKDQDGTAIGYAIYKTANLIASLKEQSALMGKEAPYAIQGAVVLLVTDGLQDPNPLDKDNPYRSMELEQAASYAKTEGVKLYVVNIEPQFGTAQYLPNLKQMKQVAEMTGGQFYHASSPSDVAQFVDAINEIEASKIYETPDSSRLPTLFKKVSYSPYLLQIAFFLVLAGALLDETVFRRTPC